MPLAATQLALCVFSTERLDKGSGDHRVHTRVHLLRGMYLLSIGAARNTHLYTLLSTFTHTLGESRERESLSTHGIQAMCGLVCGYSLVQS